MTISESLLLYVFLGGGGGFGLVEMAVYEGEGVGGVVVGDGEGCF